MSGQTFIITNINFVFASVTSRRNNVGYVIGDMRSCAGVYEPRWSMIGGKVCTHHIKFGRRNFAGYLWIHAIKTINGFMTVRATDTMKKLGFHYETN